jgi:hypothetical protein
MKAAFSLAICIALSASPALAASDQVDTQPPLQCGPDVNLVVSGTVAKPGSKFSNAIGLTIDAPESPGTWKILRCDAHSIVFQSAGSVEPRLLTATANLSQLAPWSDTTQFAGAFTRAIGAADRSTGQQLKIDSTRLVQSADGRPCLDILRSGKVTQGPLGPQPSRELFRGCHLQDKRGPEAVALLAFKAVGPMDAQEFEKAAMAFVATAKLPPQVR